MHVMFSFASPSHQSDSVLLFSPGVSTLLQSSPMYLFSFPFIFIRIVMVEFKILNTCVSQNGFNVICLYAWSEEYLHFFIK